MSTPSRSGLSSSDVIKRVHAIGSYYGFTPLSSLTSVKRGQGAKGPMPESINLDALDPAAKDTVTLLKQVRDAGLTPSAQQPLFIWHTNAAAGRPAPKQIVVQFHILGVEHAIADAVLIRALIALVRDLGKGEPKLKLNSMGDKETRSRYARELTQFFRKHATGLPEDCTNCAKQGDVLEAAFMLCRASPEAGMLPSPTDHLSEVSRKHFENVLEYLEATDTGYDLAPTLLSRGQSWSDTCFEIEGTSPQGVPLVAWGSRYQDLSRHFFKTHLPSVGAILRFPTIAESTPIPAIKERGATRFVFVHIGDEAKRECMKLADDLRRARIPLTQAIGVHSLSEQMRLAEVTNPPYLLIMGRKEALERSVILRERSTYTESIIPLDSLIDRLKLVA